jgi:5-methylcytosine-specific restriction endonuclease McrA
VTTMLRALELFPWMQPHKIRSWDQAVTLVVQGKVDVLEVYEMQEPIRSAGNRGEGRPPLVIEVPAVIRLRKTVARRKKSVKFSRSNVYARDHHRCCYCGERFGPDDLNYDHVVPRERGGRTDWLNIVTSCYGCNARKRNRTPAEAGMRMHYQPHEPSSLPHAPLLFAVDSAPPQWLPYLEAARAMTA